MTLNIFEIILERVLLYIFLEGIMDLAPIGVLCILGIQYIDGYIIKFMECMNLKRCFKNHRSFQFLSLKNN